MQTEEQIRRTLRLLVRNRTTILITHRPSLLALADRVLVIEGGQLREEQGTNLPAGDEGGRMHRPGRSATT